MREQDGHLRVGPFDEEGRDAGAVRGVEPKVPRGMNVRRRRGLEQQGADHVSHGFVCIYLVVFTSSGLEAEVREGVWRWLSSEIGHKICSFCAVGSFDTQIEISFE